MNPRPSVVRFVVAGSLAFMFSSVALAGPEVTWEVTPDIAGSGYTACDFFYSASPGAEFTDFRLTISTSHAMIVDPDPLRVYDQDGDAVDTWMNTVCSLNGWGFATHVFYAYKPMGPIFDSPPVDYLDWAVFDTYTGDSNDPWGNGLVTAPWHLARILIDDSPSSVISATFTAYDTSSPTVPTTAVFYRHVPEPSSALLAALGFVALMRLVSRRS